MNTFITSDLHLGHANILKFCPTTRARFNNDIDYMTGAMIAEWNAAVNTEDTVYILGDVAFLPAAKAVEILKKLNGTKILIKGNHDRKLLLDLEFQNCFAEIHTDWVGKLNGQYVHMYHFPVAEWDRMHYGAVHFHGHLHGNPSGLEQYRARDVGMDATGKIVISIDDAIASALTGEIKGHH